MKKAPCSSCVLKREIIVILNRFQLVLEGDLHLPPNRKGGRENKKQQFLTKLPEYPVHFPQ